MVCLITFMLFFSVFITTDARKFDSEYDIDVVEINGTTTTPHLVDISLEGVERTRGIFGGSGYMELKEDIDTDVSMARVQIFFSSTGFNFQKSPFRIPDQNFTSVLNGAYRLYLMDELKKCCIDSPYFEVFTSPLTKRRIECENCLFPSTNIPPALRLGYYRIFLTVYKGVNFTICALLRLALK